MRYREKPEEASKVEPSRKAVQSVKKQRQKENKPTLKEELKQLNPPLTPEQKDKIPFEYLNKNTFIKRLVNEKSAEEFAIKLIIWAKTTPNAIKVSEFYLEEGLDREDYFQLKKKFPIVESAHNLAIQFLGNTRERRMLEGDWQTAPAMFMMGHYDEDWKSEMQHRDEVKAKINKLSEVELQGILETTSKTSPHTEEVARHLLEKGIDVRSVTPSTTDISSKDKA